MPDTEDIATLERVLTRLAFTDDDRLESVLMNLLPRLIAMITVDASPVRAKVLEVLSHLNSRVKPNRQIKLPCGELLKAFNCTNIASFCLNAVNIVTSEGF